MGKPTKVFTPEQQDAAEQRRVAALSDADVLKLTGHGKFGPALVGPHVHARSAAILKGTAGGRFGPAITDPDYAPKQAAVKAEAAAADQALTDAELLDKYEQEALDAGYGAEAAEDIAARRVTALRSGRPVWALADPGKSPPSTAPADTTGTPGTPPDPLDLEHPENPWTYVTLGGAKKLAQEHQVSYKPSIKRKDLIAALIEAAVPAPPLPTPEGKEDEDDDEEGRE
jgi:hypothetical protein